MLRYVKKSLKLVAYQSGPKAGDKQRPRLGRAQVMGQDCTCFH